MGVCRLFSLMVVRNFCSSCSMSKTNKQTNKRKHDSSFHSCFTLAWNYFSYQLDSSATLKIVDKLSPEKFVRRSSSMTKVVCSNMSGLSSVDTLEGESNSKNSHPLSWSVMELRCILSLIKDPLDDSDFSVLLSEVQMRRAVYSFFSVLISSQRIQQVCSLFGCLVCCISFAFLVYWFEVFFLLSCYPYHNNVPFICERFSFSLSLSPSSSLYSFLSHSHSLPFWNMVE